jgi:hypothetical protein
MGPITEKYIRSLKNDFINNDLLKGDGRLLV